MRILIVGLHYAPEVTGNAPYTSSLARGLSKRGHDVRVITGYPHYPDWKVFDGFDRRSMSTVEDGVCVERRRQYVPASPSPIMRLLSECSYGFRLLLARWGKPDVVLAVSPALFGSVFAVLKMGVLRLPGGVWVQDLYSLGVTETGQGGATLGRVMKAIEGATLRSVRGVSVIHDRFRMQAITGLSVPESRVRVIRNWSHIGAVGPFDRDAVRERMGWRPDEVIALHAGNMGVKQGLENVVEAARVADDTNANVRFVLLGNGNQRSKLLAQAEGVQHIQFLDPLADGEFLEVLGSADVLVVNELAGVSEMSVPSKLTTYFSTGLPVVAATNIGGATASEIEASGGGIRVDAGDPRALVDAILALESDPELAAKLGAAGLAFRDAHLTEDAAIDSYAEWLASLVASKRK